MKILFLITIAILAAVLADIAFINAELKRMANRHVQDYHDLAVASGNLRSDVTRLDESVHSINGAYASVGLSIRDIESQVKTNKNNIKTLDGELCSIKEELVHVSEDFQEQISELPKRKEYSEEFKTECINFILDNQISIKEAAEKLEVPYYTLRYWWRRRDKE